MSEPDGGGALDITVNDLGPEEAVARLVQHGADLQVSDLFFTSHDHHVAVQARHLGILRLLSILPLELGRRCMAHIKVMAGMDVAERRRPQDGRWIYQPGAGGAIDLRINIIPTLHGEDFTLRLLPRDFKMLELENLGMHRGDYNKLLLMLNTPGGLLLVTGPTGSGKTTTLYACIRNLNDGRRKINTIEDPIEYAVEGVRQSQVNPRLDLGFGELLRNVLRQAPDIIMVGEVRDPITAETAVRAANSGHLVLATMHAPLAAGGVQSMLSLGVHPHFLSSALLGVVAQRLVRTLCPDCKAPIEVPEVRQMFEEIRPWLEPGEGQVLYGPKGCPKCRMQGYSGRTGVYEVLPASRGIREQILERQPTQALRRKAIEEGMIEFRRSALLKVARGETSIEELFRVLPSDDLGEV